MSDALSQVEDDDSLKSVAADLTAILGEVPLQFVIPSLALTLKVSALEAHKTGFDHWVAASKVDGFWDAMQSAAAYFQPKLMGLKEKDRWSPDLETKNRILSELRATPPHARVRELYEEAKEIVEYEPELLTEMAKALLGRINAPIPPTVEDFLRVDKEDPTWRAARGWTSHHFWLMNPAALCQMIPGLSADMAKKLRSTHGLFSHKNPPITGCREGVDSFNFRSDWEGPRPRPSSIRNNPPSVPKI